MASADEITGPTISAIPWRPPVIGSAEDIAIIGSRSTSRRGRCRWTIRAALPVSAARRNILTTGSTRVPGDRPQRTSAFFDACSRAAAASKQNSRVTRLERCVLRLADQGAAVQDEGQIGAGASKNTPHLSDRSGRSSKDAGAPTERKKRLTRAAVDRK